MDLINKMAIQFTECLIKNRDPVLRDQLNELSMCIFRLLNAEEAEEEKELVEKISTRLVLNDLASTRYFPKEENKETLAGILDEEIAKKKSEALKILADKKKAAKEHIDLELWFKTP